MTSAAGSIAGIAPPSAINASFAFASAFVFQFHRLNFSLPARISAASSKLAALLIFLAKEQQNDTSTSISRLA